MEGELSLNFHRNNVHGHFEQVCKNQVSELKVKVDTCSQGSLRLQKKVHKIDRNISASKLAAIGRQVR